MAPTPLVILEVIITVTVFLLVCYILRMFCSRSENNWEDDPRAYLARRIEEGRARSHNSRSRQAEPRVELTRLPPARVREHLSHSWLRRSERSSEML
jgi:hypothetical protein